MAHKHYILKDESVKTIRDTMEAEDLPTETAALEYILMLHQKKKKRLTDEIADVLQERFMNVLESTRHAARSADQSADLILDCLNTIMIERDYRVCYSAENHPSEVLLMAAEGRKKKLAKLKQRKDHKLSKRRYLG